MLVAIRFRWIWVGRVLMDAQYSEVHLVAIRFRWRMAEEALHALYGGDSSASFNPLSLENG